MASSSNASSSNAIPSVTSISPSSPRAEKVKDMREHLKRIAGGWTAATRLSKKMGGHKEIKYEFDKLGYDNLGVAQPLATKVSENLYNVTIKSKDLTKLVNLLRTETVTVTLAKQRLFNKRGAGSSISVFGNPRYLKQEMLNFIKNAPILKDLVAKLTQTNISTRPGVGTTTGGGTTTQSIITSLISIYAYDQSSTDRPTLAFYSTYNRKNLQYLLKQSYSGGVFNVIGTDDKGEIILFSQQATLDQEQEVILTKLLKGTVPRTSYKNIMDALATVGISKDSPRIPTNELDKNGKTKTLKPINGQIIGVDEFMLENLSGILEELDKEKDFDKSNMLFASLQRLTSKGFDGSGEFKLGASDKDDYKKLVVEPSKTFTDAYKAAKKIIDDPRKSDMDAIKAYQDASSKSNNPNYANLVGSFKDINAKYRIANDRELLQIKLDRLVRSMKVNHPNVDIQ